VTPRRVLAPLLSLVLAWPTLVATGATEAAETPRVTGTPGSAGIGDPYFPDDGNGGIDVLHYDVRDGYAFGSGRLSGRTRLTVRATQDLSRFDLDFLLPVRSVTVNGRAARFHRTREHELRITPRRALRNGAEFRVAVRYAGRPGSETSHGESNWLADAGEVVTVNEPHMATWWFPANDHPRDKATFDIRITVPKHLDVIANGVRVGKRKGHRLATTHWRATEPMAPYLAFFAAGSFETRATSCQGIPSYVAVSSRAAGFAPGDAARNLADQTCSILTALSGVLGPYPFSATGGLMTGLPLGFSLETQTRPTYPAAAGSGQLRALVAHELAHQWFGDSVSVARWRDIWLNEGFAQYLQTYYLTELVGGGSMQSWLVGRYDAHDDADVFWNLSLDDPGPSRLFDGAVYERGAMAVQALRHRIGDVAFWTLLRTWLAQRALGNGSVADFEALAGAVSGQDLTDFFEAWLHTRMAPAKTVGNGLA
jgi:aminopeptidase N